MNSGPSIDSPSHPLSSSGEDEPDIYEFEEDDDFDDDSPTENQETDEEDNNNGGGNGEQSHRRLIPQPAINQRFTGHRNAR